MKKEIKEELNDHAPFLAGMQRKEEGYTVPKDYFANMEADLWEQLKPETETKTVTASAPRTSWLDGLIQQVSWLFQPRMALQLASVALLVLGGIFFFNRTATTEVDALAELTAEEASEYVLANLDEFEMESLIDIGFVEEDFAEVDEAFFNETDVDDLLDELQRENIDLETLEVYL